MATKPQYLVDDLCFQVQRDVRAGLLDDERAATILEALTSGRPIHLDDAPAPYAGLAAKWTPLDQIVDVMSEANEQYHWQLPLTFFSILQRQIGLYDMGGPPVSPFMAVVPRFRFANSEPQEFLRAFSWARQRLTQINEVVDPGMIMQHVPKIRAIGETDALPYGFVQLVALDLQAFTYVSARGVLNSQKITDLAGCEALMMLGVHPQMAHLMTGDTGSPSLPGVVMAGLVVEGEPSCMVFSRRESELRFGLLHQDAHFYGSVLHTVPKVVPLSRPEPFI